MASDRKPRLLSTGRAARLASMARAGLGTARAVAMGSGVGIESAVERLGELRGLGTKVGQMAGLVEANLPDDVRARVGPALQKLRAQAARSPYEAIAKQIEDDLGAPPEKLFARFDREAFASASLGQVHDAEHPDGRHVAVKVQHPGIQQAFESDLTNVASLGRVATAFLMPSEKSRAFLGGLEKGFLAELDYGREAASTERFRALTTGDPDLVLPEVVRDRCGPHVLTTTFLEGVPVETARGFADDARRRQAAAIRRLVLSAFLDHGVLYADAHAGNFLFRQEGTVGVLDFGSVIELDPSKRGALRDFRAAAESGDRAAFEDAVVRLLDVRNPKVAAAIAETQWLAIGGLVRGDAGDDARLRRITQRIGETKNRLLGERFDLPWFLPFVMRTMMALNALMGALKAPASGPLGRLTPASDVRPGGT